MPFCAFSRGSAARRAARTKSAFALLAVLLLCGTHRATAQYAASPLTQLSLHSETGDVIGQGKDHLFNANDGDFTSSVQTDGDGKADYVTVSLGQGAGGESWQMEFSSRALGKELVPGTYDLAQRAAFANPGYPGLDVSGDGRGSGTITGTFTVTEAVYDYTTLPPTLTHFAATFEQHSEGALPALTGTIYYQSVTHPPVPDTSYPTTTISCTGPIGHYGRYNGPVQVTLSATDPDGAADVAATTYTLDGGAAQTYTAPFTLSADGLHSVSYSSADKAGNREPTNLHTVWIDRSTAPSAAAQSRLIMHSQPGDVIGDGQDYLYTDGNGTFRASALTVQEYGQTGAPVNTVKVAFDTANGEHTWLLQFSTQDLGVPIAVGTYQNAIKASLPALGHPGLDVSEDTQDSNPLTGQFSIVDLVLDSSQSATSPQIVSFAATFEQHSNGATPALTGTLYYHSTAYVGTPLTLTFSEAAIPDGQTMGTVTLASPAPTGGTVVTLSSGTPAVAGVPATVTVPAGALSASFPVTSTVVTTVTTVQIGAAANGVSCAATLTVIPLDGWTAAALASGPDGKTRVLWNHEDAAAIVWTLSADGSLAAHTDVLGPFTGWTATALSVGADNAAHILWNNTDGRMTVWTLPTDGSAPTYSPYYGPYTGWTATALSVGPDNKAHVLWNNVNGSMTLWTLPATGPPSYSPVFGPITGWTAKSVAADSGSAARVLWTNTDGRMTLWTIPASGSPSYGPYYGPFAGWTATALSVDTDNAAHVLWDHTDGHMTLWTIPTTGSPSYSPTFGPFAGWNALDVSISPDGDSHVLWDNTDGRMTPWTLDTADRFVGTFPTYGPY